MKADNGPDDHALQARFDAQREHDLAEVEAACLEDLDAHSEMRRRTGCDRFADDGACDCGACARKDS